MSPHLHPESAESADLIATAKEEAARLRDQQAAVKTTEYRLGTALHQIKKDKLFVAAGYATFAAFVAALGLKLKDADWYIATRNIPAEFLAGRRLATGKLALISDAPEWLRASLCAAVDTETGKKTLRDAIRAARKAHRRGASTAEAIAAALRVLAEDRQKRAAGGADPAESARGLKRQLTNMIRVLGRWRARAEEAEDEALAALEPLGQELADALVDLGLAQPETKPETKIVTKIFTKVVAVHGAVGELKNVKTEATPLSGNEKRQTARSEEANDEDEDDEDEDEDEDDNDEGDEDDGEDDDNDNDDAPNGKVQPPPVKDPPPPVKDPPPPPPPSPPPGPAPAPWPPAAATCPAEELVKTEAQAGDKDVPPNPAALEQLRQVPTVSFQGQEYPLTLIGDAFAACLDDYYQKLLNEGLCFLIGAHGQLEWQEIGKRRLRNLARIAEEESPERLPPGVPLGLLPAWAERCAQNDLPARFPICFQSLLQFRIHEFRNQVFVLVRVPAQQPYRTLFNEAADWVELIRPAFWRRHHPEVHAIFRAERARLHATGMDYIDAMKQAEETIAAERRARGLRE